MLSLVLFLAMARLATCATVALVSSAGDNQTSPVRHRLSAASVAGVVVALTEATAQPASKLHVLTANGNEWIPLAEWQARQDYVPRVMRVSVAGHAASSTSEVVAALPWRKFSSVTFDQGLSTDFAVAGSRLRLGQGVGAEDPGPDGATGLTLWDGAILLAKWLERRPGGVRGRRVVELGAGLGLLGVAVSLLPEPDAPRSITLTDLPYALPGCRATVAANRHGRAVDVDVQELDWFDPPTTTEWDVVLAADTVWLDHLVHPFVQTLAALCPPGGPQSVFLAYQRRGKTAHERLWLALAQAGFVSSRMPTDELTCELMTDEHGQCAAAAAAIDLSIFELTRP